MKNVPSHHHPEIQVAIRMARILAEADLVHPVADHVGEMDVMDWAAKFVAQHGTYLAPTQLDRSQYSAAIKASTYQSAMNQGWVVREERETRGQSPADIEFKQAVAMALHIQEIPGHVPRSASHRALFDGVVKDLQERALHSLRMGGLHKKGEMSFETDGRFEKMKFHGISIASCSAGEREKAQWVAALESNLGLRVDPDADHQVVVAVDGRDLVCTGADVRIQVFSQRLAVDGGPGNSLSFAFTSEGVITDCFSKDEGLVFDDALLGTSSEMYDEIAEGLQTQAESANGEVSR